MPFRDRFFVCFCGGNFDARKLGTKTLRTCYQCRGIWVTHGDFREMLQVMEHAWEKAGQPETITVGPSDRLCLECRSPMTRLLITGVEVESCEKHGMYFDNPELSEILYNYMEKEG